MNLSDTPITDACVDHLAQRPNLIGLEVERTGLIAQGIARLRTALPGATINFDAAEDGAARVSAPRNAGKAGDVSE
ncbi:MAG TPA: hypothetical protein VKU82_02805 [Planctomycetaceae bacterium]|nr:hypothetical protein [Planctomycetaceae bacterium]